jgi:hypothetical protein
MKINVLHIIRGHIQSLGDRTRPNVFLIDIMTFYILPFFIALIFSYIKIEIHRDVYNVMISAFAIFAALLLNVQVALFSIYHRTPSKNSEDPQDDRLEIAKADKNKLFGELNTNISYLVVVACICVVVFLCLHLINASNQNEKYAIVYMVMHFMITLLMVIKRSYAAFQREYM